MAERGILEWVNSKLTIAEASDLSRDFRDGTVLMELVILLLPHNETAVLEALETFSDKPTSLIHSLGNIKSVLTCLQADGTDTAVKPLEIFRGEKGSTVRILETLRDKYDNGNPDLSCSPSKQEVVPPDLPINTENESATFHIQEDVRARRSSRGSNSDTRQIDPRQLFSNHDRIIIKIKDSDPLCVDKERLTKDSPVFRQFIDELHFYELEMDDFEADTVGVFLTLLEDRKVDDIQEDKFRELHKMSRVYEVEWLRKECYNWLSRRIVKDIVDVDKLFVFEECLFILRKWEERNLMNILIATTASTDNSPFITRYFENFEKLDSVQLDLMLTLGGSNCKVFLQTVQQNLDSKNHLGENTNFLLERMNLAFCIETNNELYTELFATISSLTDISIADMRFAFQLSTKTQRSVISRKKIRNNNRETEVVFDEEKYKALYDKLEGLDDIIAAVSDDQIRSMYLVVDLIIWFFFRIPLNSEELKTFFSKFLGVCRSKRLQKVSRQYLDMIISSLEHSPLQKKVHLIHFLDIINKNEMLSTNNQNVKIARCKRIEVSPSSVYQDYFTFKHPCNTNCDRSDSKCGFILQCYKLDGGLMYELSVNDKDYENTGLHFHDSISAVDMSTYCVYSVSSRVDAMVSVPDNVESVDPDTGESGPDKGESVPEMILSVPEIWSSYWWWEDKWFPDKEWWEFNERYVALNISDYLVAK